MTQLEITKSLLNIPVLDTSQDGILTFYLTKASDIICYIRNTNVVESQYSTHQVSIAIELYNKIGVEGQISHNELGINRGYEASDVSPSLLNQIIPFAKTPYSVVRTVV